MSPIKVFIWYSICSVLSLTAVEESCPFEGLGCLQCLSRNSMEIQVCQQDYIYLTYSSSDANRMNTEQFCSGHCPLILAAANYLCKSSTVILKKIFSFCPDYMVVPTGAGVVNANFSGQHCLQDFTEERCVHCASSSSQSVYRCIQYYLFITYSTSSQHLIFKQLDTFCATNCPVILSTVSWYCNTSSMDNAFQYCTRNGFIYCREEILFNSADYNSAVTNCSMNCSSIACTEGSAKYGCCLSQSQMDNSLCTLPECTLQTTSAIAEDISIDTSCPFERFGCVQCLARDNPNITYCQQLFLHISRTNMNNEEERKIFCSGECPFLLGTANFYCGASQQILTDIISECPMYEYIPNRVVRISSNFSGQNCLDGNGPLGCQECVSSSSTSLLNCIQSYIITRRPGSNIDGMRDYCQSDCPLQLGKLTWYCNTLIQPSEFFDLCQGDGNSFFCQTIMASDADLSAAAAACETSCNSTVCITATEQYRCCLRKYLQSEVCPDIPECIISVAKRSIGYSMLHHAKPPIIIVNLVGMIAMLMLIVVSHH